MVLTSDRPSASGVDHGPSRLGDVPLGRRELRVERFRRGARGRDELRRRLGRLLDVRAREVELDRGDAAVAVEPLAARREVVGEKPPTETHSCDVDSASRGRCSETNASMPGPWRPIELSIPSSVSAMRTGGSPRAATA